MAVFRKQYTKPLPEGAIITEVDVKCTACWIDRYGRKRTARVITRRDGTKRISLRCSTLTVKYTDSAGVIREISSGCRTKNAAESVQTDLRQRVELVKAGVISAAEAAASQHSSVEIREHIDAYVKHLSLCASPKHVLNVRRQLLRLTVECKFSRLVDLRADRLEQWLELNRREGMGARTTNTYLAALRAFVSWCADTDRLTVDPFRKVPKADESADPRHLRRALTEEELGRLLAVARLRPIAEYGRKICRTVPAPGQRKRSNWRRMPLDFKTITEAAERGRAALANNPHLLALLERRGQERELIYRVLLLTGLRKGELASITVGQVDLDHAPFSLTLAAADEKRRKGTTIPLRNDLAAEIRNFLRTSSTASYGEGIRQGVGCQAIDPSQPLFRVPSALDKILNHDLAAAGIPKRDARNRVVDVHAMRHTFGTYLSRAGVPLRTAQAAMRHSDPRLTANVYTDPQLLDVAAAVNSLPTLHATNAPKGASCNVAARKLELEGRFSTAVNE